MLLVDTNVLIDVLEDEPEWADWSIAQLRAQAKVHPLTINPIIYAELSLTFSTVEALDEAIESLALTVLEIPPPTLFLAGKGVRNYQGTVYKKPSLRAKRGNPANQKAFMLGSIWIATSLRSSQ